MIREVACLAREAGWLMLDLVAYTLIVLAFPVILLAGIICGAIDFIRIRARRA